MTLPNAEGELKPFPFEFCLWGNILPKGVAYKATAAQYYRVWTHTKYKAQILIQTSAAQAHMHTHCCVAN